jgi:hypothetical protein
MIRLLLLCALTTFAHQSLFAQERPTRDANQTRTLNAEVPRDKAVHVASMSPNITMNGTKCKFQNVSILRGSDHKYSVRISFEENCSGTSEAIFNTGDLEDALELKELIMNFRMYESLNITGKKGEPLSFELNFHAPVRR